MGKEYMGINNQKIKFSPKVTQSYLFSKIATFANSLTMPLS